MKNVKRLLVKMGIKKLKGTIIVLGLANSGKSTIVNWLKDPHDQIQEISPTVGYSVEQVQMDKCKLTVVDLSGQLKYAKLWECYYEDAQGIVFVVDACDPDKLVQAKDVMMEAVTDDRLRRLPLVIFANKSDLPESLSGLEVTTHMDLNNSLHAYKSWNVFSSSAVSGDGLKDGLRWLLALLKVKP